MWVIGSDRRSITVLSTSVPSPSVIRRACFLVWAATSRTSRGMRWNTDFTGWARMAMTLSWISRVSCSSSSKPTAMVDDRASPASWTRWASMAWLITSSPTRLMRRSTRSRSTRMVGATAVEPAFAASPGAASAAGAGRGGATGITGAEGAAMGAAGSAFSAVAARISAMTSTSGVDGSSSAAASGSGCSDGVMARSQSPSTNSKTS